MKKMFLGLFIFLFVCSAESAHVYKIKGEIFYRENSSAQWKKLRESDENMTLKSGYEIRTSRASSIEILMDDGSKIKMAPLSYSKLEEENQTESKLNLFAGKIRNWVKKFSKKFSIKTPTAVCAVRGTDFVTSVDAEGNTRVEVYDGRVLTSDSNGMESLVRRGQFIEVNRQGLTHPQDNPNPPQSMDSSLGDRKLIAKKEIYTDISKESILKQAQSEMQMSEYQNRKVAIDAFGNRVRMEEYIVRPAAEQFKYVVLNTRKNDFNFGKILFTFDEALPDDLSLATKNMINYEGSTEPRWVLKEMTSIISNTLDKVTEDASGGHMVADNPAAPSRFSLFFKNYAMYAAGPAQANENGGLGRFLWGYSDDNNNNRAEEGEFTFLGESAPTSYSSNPLGDNVFYNVSRNDYLGGTWIENRYMAVFDNGKIASVSDFNSGLSGSKNDVLDKLNFETVYTSSLFEGRKIDLIFSARLLKDSGIASFE